MKGLTAIIAATCAVFAAVCHAADGEQLYVNSDAKNVGYEEPTSYTAKFDIINKDGLIQTYDCPVSAQNYQADIDAAFGRLSGCNVNSVALNALRALADVEMLREYDKYLGNRIDALEQSANAAFASIDKVKVVDDHGNKIETLFKLVKEGSEVEVSTAGVPVDGRSVDFTGTSTDPNTPAPIEVKGFGANSNNPWLLPHPRDGAIHWGHVAMLADGKSIEATYGSTDVFSYTFGLKGWDTPTASPGVCVRTLSGLLHGEDPDGPHYVLTKCGDVLHYTPLGEPMEDGAAVDDLSITTNRASGAVTQGKASLYGFNAVNTKSGYIPSKGEGSPAELKWLDPAEMVDNSSLALTTADGVKVWEIKGAHIYAGNHRRHYFGTGDDSTLGWHELPTNDVDEASIEIHDGKLQIAGFDTAVPNSVPRKDDNGRVAWSGASSATNTYVAGSYISMTDNGGGVVTVSAQNKTLDVITDISFAFNDDNQLVATITKQTITVLDKATQTSETTATVPLWKQDVVIASEYSTSTHAFKNTTLGGVRTVETLPSQPSQTTVFTATAHSGQ